MRRIVATLALALAVSPALGGMASADPLPRCVPVPDLDGHVWYVCPR